MISREKDETRGVLTNARMDLTPNIGDVLETTMNSISVPFTGRWRRAAAARAPADKSTHEKRFASDLRLKEKKKKIPHLQK